MTTDGLGVVAFSCGDKEGFGPEAGRLVDRNPKGSSTAGARDDEATVVVDD